MLLVLLGLTCFRLTRLITADTIPLIADPIKKVVLWAYRSDRRRGRWVGDLLQCHWCVSVWVAAALTAAAWTLIEGGVGVHLLWWGAVAATGGFTAQTDQALACDRERN